MTTYTVKFKFLFVDLFVNWSIGWSSFCCPLSRASQYNTSQNKKINFSSQVSIIVPIKETILSKQDGIKNLLIVPLYPGICSKSQQTETYSGHIAPQSGKTDRVPDALPHGSFRGWTVQWREGVSD